MTVERHVTASELDARLQTHYQFVLRHLDTRCDAIDSRLNEVIQVQQRGLDALSAYQVSATRLDSRVGQTERDVRDIKSNQQADGPRRRITVWDVSLFGMAVGLAVMILKFLKVVGP